LYTGDTLFNTQLNVPQWRLASEKEGRNTPQSGLALEERVKTKKPAMFKVLLHNDDFTSMEFVTHLLSTIFHHSQSECTRIMLHVHRTGIGIAGVYTREIAETKVRKALDMARKSQLPLQCTTEEA
jgi:ATP-dependent Clp protease adaptor protein ClpS